MRQRAATRRPGRSVLGELALGRYLAADSPLHAAPAWGKAALLSIVAVAAFWLGSAAAFAALGMGLALVVAVARVPQSTFWRSLRPLLWLAAFTLAAGAFLNHPGASLLAPRFSWIGLHQGAVYAARLLLITLLTTLFFLTTRPDDAISLGVRLMAPLRLLGIEAKELSLLVHLAYRFVPMLAREIEEMRLGREARNLTPDRGLIARGRTAVDSMVTLVIAALHRAEVTGMALEQRGLLDHWKPSKLGGGRWAGLWPLLSLLALAAAMVGLDSRLL